MVCRRSSILVRSVVDGLSGAHDRRRKVRVVSAQATKRVDSPWLSRLYRACRDRAGVLIFRLFYSYPYQRIWISWPCRLAAALRSGLAERPSIRLAAFHGDVSDRRLRRSEERRVGIGWRSRRGRERG